MSYVVTVAIFLLIGGWIGGYALFVGWALKQAGIPWWMMVAISSLFVVILVGLGVAFVARIQEISQEGKDDYRHY